MPDLKKKNMKLRYKFTADTLVVQSEVSVISWAAERLLTAQKKLTLRVSG